MTSGQAAPKMARPKSRMQAQMNLNVSGVHTVFLPSTSANAAIASKYIRDIARFGGDVSSMVPVPVAKRIRKKFVKP